MAGAVFGVLGHAGTQLLLGRALRAGLSAAAGGLVAVRFWAQLCRRDERPPDAAS